MTSITPWPQLLPLLADQAHEAGQPGTCPRCPHGISRGQRIARLATGEWAHAWCAASADDRGRVMTTGKEVPHER